jgi:PAS domain S-box-containing protein
MRPDPHAKAVSLTQARRQLIHRRLPVFALGWLVVTLGWAGTRALETWTLAPIILIAAQLTAVALGIYLCRRALTLARVDALVIALLAVFALSWTVFGASHHGRAVVVNVLIAALCATAGALLTLDWRRELVLVLVTLGPAWLADPWLVQAIPPVQSVAILGLAALVCLTIAEGSFRSFRNAVIHRAAEDETRRELAASRDAYRDLAEKARDHIWTCDLEGRLTYANAATAAFFRVPASALIGRSYATMVTDNPRNAGQDDVFARLAAGETLPPLLVEVAPYPGDTHREWHEMILSGMRDAEGRLTGIRGTSRDVTPRVVAEERLRESEERFRLAFAQTSVGMSLTDMHGHAIQLNQAICDMLGYTREELTAMTIDDVTHPDDIVATHAMRRRLAEGRADSFELEKRFVRKTGETVWGHVNASILRTPSGEPRHYIALVQDVTARRQATAALQESEAKFRNVTESMSVVVFIYQDARFRYVNEMACAVSGYTREELLAMDLATLIPSSNREAAEALARAMGGGLSRWTSVERRMARKDGRAVYVAWSGVVIDYEGAPAVLGTGIDVTEQRQAQQALARSEGRFRRLFESNIVGVMFAQTAGAITLANDAFLEIVGYARAELSKVSWRDLTPEDHLDRDTRALHQLGRTSTAEPYEKDFRHRDGHRVPVLLAAARLEEQPDTAACVVVDLTQLKRAEDALRTSEQRYRGLVESQHELILRATPEGTLTFVNDAYCTAFGRTRGELLGESWVPFCHPDDLQQVQDIVASLAHPPHRATFESRALTADGVRWIEWEAGAVFVDGALVEIQGAGRDVTGRREAQEALRRTVHALQTSEDNLRRLAHRQTLIREEERKRVGFDLHDDVCQELVGVGILIESARRRMGADTPGYDELGRGVRYVNEVVEHLRKLARELRPMQLHDLGLTGSLRALADGMSSSKTTVAAVVPAEVPRLDEHTEVAVYRIAQEAVANALRHGAPTHVSISLAATADRLELEVRDDGRGFDPKAARVGAGGLASMEERALALGGLLEVHSAPGTGASVRLHCPLRERTPASAA